MVHTIRRFGAFMPRLSKLFLALFSDEQGKIIGSPLVPSRIAIDHSLSLCSDYLTLARSVQVMSQIISCFDPSENRTSVLKTDSSGAIKVFDHGIFRRSDFFSSATSIFLRFSLRVSEVGKNWSVNAIRHHPMISSGMVRSPRRIPAPSTVRHQFWKFFCGK